MEQSEDEQLRHEYSALKKKADAQTMQLIDAEARIATLQIENDRLKEENQRLKNSEVFTDSTVETIKTLHRQFLGASAELNSSRNEVDSLKQELEEKARQ
ncbi:hypothetical protein AAVH_35188 [Aphelenchoides avenae]|nr:hypothetical protein AAVH_35188 [Aphelenchus avenae]